HAISARNRRHLRDCFLLAILFGAPAIALIDVASRRGAGHMAIVVVALSAVAARFRWALRKSGGRKPGEKLARRARAYVSSRFSRTARQGTVGVLLLTGIFLAYLYWVMSAFAVIVLAAGIVLAWLTVTTEHIVALARAAKTMRPDRTPRELA